MLATVTWKVKMTWFGSHFPHSFSPKERMTRSGFLGGSAWQVTLKFALLDSASWG
jgi:hypothetical protein